MNHYFLIVPIEFFTTLMHMLTKIVNICEYIHPKARHIIKNELSFHAMFFEWTIFCSMYEANI
jgi:hypothetical protein